MSATSKLSHGIIRALYDSLSWYSANRGAGQAPFVRGYYDMWRSLHTFSVNISPEGWSSLHKIASGMNINLKTSEEEWSFLFAVETYLHILIRIIALSKLGMSPQNLQIMQQDINSLRNVFAHSVFEWIFDAAVDSGLDTGLRNALTISINTLISVAYSLNLGGVTFDAFREMYQNIVPKEVRRSLGEFYTREDLVDEVLDAAGLNGSSILGLYESWRRSGGKERPVIMDPACGSGSFLVRVIRRCFKALGCKPDIASFIEDTVIGIDINPFAVEMSKLNIVLVLAEEMNRRCGQRVYVPRRVRVYWGDSLAIFKPGIKVQGTPTISVSIPSLAGIIGKDRFDVPDPSIFISIERLVETAYSYVKKGGAAGDFINELVRLVDPNLVNSYLRELQDLYTVIESIHKSGNSKLIELIKDSLIVRDLVGKCSYVVGNPPWVRARMLADSLRGALRTHFKYFSKDSPYNPRFIKAKVPFREQHDYSVAFVERGIELLQEEGVLGYVITSKIVRSSYAGEMRRSVLTNYRILKLIDYSLYPRLLFLDAVNYPLIFAVKKEKPTKLSQVEVTVINTGGEKRTFNIPQHSLPLNLNDQKSLWILAPSSIIQALHKISSKAIRLGDHYEIYMGVKTSKDALYYINRIHGCSQGIIDAELIDGSRVLIEAELVHLLVRGRDIDVFKCTPRQFIVFPHDVKSYEPLWNVDQKFILKTIGLLTDSWKVKSADKTLIYECKSKDNLCDTILQKMENIKNHGGSVSKKSPCIVKHCFNISYHGSRIDINIETDGGLCRVYISGLHIPGSQYATAHFLSHTRELLNRDDYKASLPPWTIFRVSADKFQDHRVAWQEMAKHTESCILRTKISVSICGEKHLKLMVPVTTVYFIVEENTSKAIKLLLYINSSLARNLIKLWAWSARGGTYRHNAFIMGHLPIPSGLQSGELWKNLSAPTNEADLNEYARNILEKEKQELEKEMINSLELNEEEYNNIIDYGEWLNEKIEAQEMEIE